MFKLRQVVNVCSGMLLCRERYSGKCTHPVAAILKTVIIVSRLLESVLLNVHITMCTFERQYTVHAPTTYSLRYGAMSRKRKV